MALAALTGAIDKDSIDNRRHRLARRFIRHPRMLYHQRNKDQ
jgi:hypothetical protein